MALSRLVGALAICLQANPVHAQEAEPKASSAQLAAEVLFLDGMKLMKEGRCAEAVVKFRDSQQLDPASGTLLNLAYCQMTLDRIASAWLTYRQALAIAQATRKTQHAQIAREQSAKLEPVLPRLVIRSVDAQARELTVELDGAPLAASVWSLPMPVDPGDHHIGAKLEDGEVWQTEFHIARAQQVVVEVPLAVASPPSAPTAPLPQSLAAPAAVKPKPSGTTPVAASSSVRLMRSPNAESPRGPSWALGLAMAGAGAFTAGAVLFVSARVNYDAARGHCLPSNACPDPYYGAEKDAISRAHLSLALAGAGIVASGIGAWLYWMPPRQRVSTRASVSTFIGPATAGLRGTW